MQIHADIHLQEKDVIGNSIKYGCKAILIIGI